MDCKDLMIGDWVVLKSNGVHPDTKIRITELSTDGCFVDDCDNFIGYEELSPIPLTEEILVKNGFEYAYNEASKMQNKQLLVANIGGHYIEVRLDKKNVAIWYDYDENESGFYSDVLLDLPRTVHQLQHLLRLCGIDKEIEL